MRRGTTTMKMISSTSTTSTSGVILISDCRLESESSLLNSMMSVSPRLGSGALGDQPDPAEAGLIEREHGLPDRPELEPSVASDHDLRVRLAAHRRAEGFSEMLGGDRLIVDPQPA